MARLTATTVTAIYNILSDIAQNLLCIAVRLMLNPGQIRTEQKQSGSWQAVMPEELVMPDSTEPEPAFNNGGKNENDQINNSIGNPTGRLIGFGNGCWP